QRTHDPDAILDQSGVSLRPTPKYRIRRFTQCVGTHSEKPPWMLAVCMVWENMKQKIKKMLERGSRCL
ncbi:MAG: hypothetical protein K2K56_10075, partial [Lachnospiraceae bacterium]|nr:hypothetical protein [Lachnospiraceae bacterium]